MCVWDVDNTNPVLWEHLRAAREVVRKKKPPRSACEFFRVVVDVGRVWGLGRYRMYPGTFCRSMMMRREFFGGARGRSAGFDWLRLSCPAYGGVPSILSKHCGSFSVAGSSRVRTRSIQFQF